MLHVLRDDGNLTPLPTQVAFWHASNFSGMEPGTSEPQFLTWLKATEPGERQAIWQGKDGGGLTAVVDFDDPLRLGDDGRYSRWGCITVLDEPIPFDAIAADEVLGPRLTGRGARALQGKPVRLSEEESLAIHELTYLPPFLGPIRAADGSDLTAKLTHWRGLHGLEPEKAIETAVAAQKKLWRAVGFTTAPKMQEKLPSGARPDLMAPGTVGEAKRVLRLTDGPNQVERYIRELEATNPKAGPWRGVLLQTIRELDSRTAARIADSPFDLSAWAVTPTSLGQLEVTRLV